MRPIFIIVAGFCILTARADDVGTENGCSFHAIQSCHEKATCIDIDVENNVWECRCPPNLDGDGLKGDNHTGCGDKECKFSEDCFPLATCNSEERCICNDGYQGDGWTYCDDINECLDNPCHPHAWCNNTVGSYTCTCDVHNGYRGNGTFCERFCNVAGDCNQNQDCIDEVCVCMSGYTTDVDNETCIDVDECTEFEPCDENANCTNTDGHFVCECKNGYTGDGETCLEMPQNCDDIKQANEDAKSGKYFIDPDFEGPLETIEVDCEMRPGFGITIHYPVITNKVRLKTTFSNYSVSYEHSVDDIKAVVNNSGFCYQEISYACYSGATLMNGDDYLVDANNNIVYSFGGATMENMCPCGQMRYCRHRPSNCNCNGTLENGLDEGKIIDKTRLPIRKFVSNVNSGRADVTIGPVKCAPKPYDFPVDCHEAKFSPLFSENRDGPRLIDVDGMDGPLNPILVHCDVESEKHVGITVVPTSVLDPVNITVAGSYPIKYQISDEHLQTLLNNSDVCQQDASYECRNSRLLNNGDKRGYFSDIRGDEKDYWPSGLGKPYKCGCGVLGVCANSSFGCNCDANDGEYHKDFGTVYNKEDLPIGEVTFLDVGPGRFSQYYVGDLKCSQKQFGVLPTCQDYVHQEFYDSHAYMIDPDGPPVSSTDTDNQDPFLVYCEITKEPPYAATIVYHDQEEINVTSNGVWNFTYKQAVAGQLRVLIERSFSCIQTVQYTCQSAPLHVNGTSVVQWETTDGRLLSYFDGEGGAPVCQCAFTVPNSCDGGETCNCDVNDITQRVDAGLLLNEDDIPMMSVNFSNIAGPASTATLAVGPLECKDLYPNCADLKVFRNGHKLISEYNFKDGQYTINPNGEEGVEPFIVECQGTRTIVPVYIEPSTPTSNDDNDSPVSRCYEILYRSKFNDTFYTITPEQIQALVENSNYCSQKLEQVCLNAPLTGFSNYSTCDFVTQSGWAGSQGRDECSCGALDKCKGGPSYSCHCDFENGEETVDGGWIHDKQYLAICEVCVGLDKLSSLSPDVTPRRRKVQPAVSDLICDIGRIGTTATCQDWRNAGMTQSGVQMIDPDGVGPIKPTPFYCGISVYPPLGWEEIVPEEPEHEIPPEGIDVVITYKVYSFEILRVLIERSGYCTQELTLECENASLTLNGEYGWYSADDQIQLYWAGNEEETTGCVGNSGECNCNLPGLQIDGGLIIDASKLPVTRVTFGPSNGTRFLTIGAVKCFNLPRDCEEIRARNLKRNPLRNNTYTIDPDQAGGVPYFAVECDFNTDKSKGITVIRTEIPPESKIVNGSVTPGETNVPVVYVGADYDQIHALAEISGFCLQGIQYTCYKSPLNNFNDPAYVYYTTYGGTNSSTFGVAGQTDVGGCACFVTDSCPEGFGCHCDAQGPMTTVDYGYETKRDVLPIENLYVGGQENPAASATFDIKDLRCGPDPFDLPKDCQEAFERNIETGEVLIQPNPNVEPFLVYCKMDKGFGVAIISNSLEGGKNVSYGEPIPVEYSGASTEQLNALTEVSVYCYLPFKYECKYTKFLSDNGYFHWKGGFTDDDRTFVGYGRPYMSECNCGREGQNGQCGGSEDRQYLLNNYRPCNCDAEDGKLRIDAGVFNTSYKLPMEELLFSDTGNPLSVGTVTLGNLYCADFDFDLDECELGFNDCDENADCINLHGYYQCRCKRGWRGFGRDNVWANGRDCHDDDECALAYCPGTSDCFNTDGSYYCVCHEGYDQTGPRTCKDIDECKRGTHNCDHNAYCTNYEGGFSCRCNRNFRGNGTHCAPMAECSCFGDPHCLSSDGKIIDYQGTCQYVMSRDNCDDLNQVPTFELLIQNDARPEIETNRPVSWVRNAIFRFEGYEIRLLPNHEVWVNGERVNFPYRKPDLFHISQFGTYVEIYTSFQVEVMWDGDDYIEIRTPGNFKGQTCGICGNYNDDPKDDLMLGPACPGYGEQVDNFFVFGNSWVDPDFVLANPECAANCTPKEEEPCEPLDEIQAMQACDLVWNKHGRFMECLEIMEEDLKIDLYRTCVYDVCATDGDVMIPVCQSAKILYQECVNLEVQLATFRTEDFCSINCGDNMEYLPVGAVNQSTCLDFLNATRSTDTEPPFSEGCFCIEGFYFDGESCVEEDDCGCIYEDQYYKVGDEITLDECRSRGVCYSNHSVVFDGITCDENAECKQQDGRYGCHCNYGFYGNGVDCTKDKCLPDPCGANETCVRNPEKSDGYECICDMGFVGNCGNCTEIDECSTRLNDCPYRSECINTVGGYKCVCEEGTYMYNGNCVDLDECNSEGAAICGNNSRCSNKIGTYHCPCCDGFEKDENGTCVEKEGAVNGVICCVCDIDICDEPGEVCGEDFQTYNTIGDMIISNCEKGLPPRLWQQVDYNGSCKSKCSPDLCPKYQSCQIDSVTGKPTCVCDKCTAAELESDVEVCTKNLDIYPNFCTFKTIQCELDREVELHPDMKPCHDKQGVSLIGPWGPWSPCSVTCGKGQQTKTRTPYDTLPPDLAEEYPLELNKDCYEDPCPGSVCVNTTCEQNAAECFVNEIGEAECECPNCENVDVEPVCGFVTNIVGGPRNVTWRSECDLLSFVCNHNIPDFEYMYDGHCRATPLDCTRIPNMQHLSGGPDGDNSYVSEKKYSLNKCAGGCGAMKDDCCQAVETTKQSIPLKKGNSIWYQEFDVIEKCECVDIGKP